MSGKSEKSNGRGGRGRNERSGRGRGRGLSYTGASKTQKSGLCKALESNVYDYGHKAAADQMRTSCEKLVQYVGTTYGQDTSNELHNLTTLVLPEPVHTATVLTRHAAREQMIRKGQANLQQARKAQKVILQAAVTQGNDLEAPLKLASSRTPSQKVISNRKRRSRLN
jgi:hypothetical protein